MDQSIALDVGRQAMQVAMMVSLPILAVSLFLGIIVSIFQALTQVQEATLTFVPKLIGISVVVAFLGHWMLMTITGFTVSCLEKAGTVTSSGGM